MKYAFTGKHVVAIVLLISGYQLKAQNIGSQFSIGFYKMREKGDTNNYHSSFRDFTHQSSFVLPISDTSKKRSWLHRKIFKEHLLQYERTDYALNVSFLPDFMVGRSSDAKTLWLNTRGVLAEGRLGKKFYFSTSFFENQGRFPSYIDSFARYQKIIPTQGTTRPYGSNGIDYNYASALLAFRPSKYLDIQLGYDRNFIGDGYRSILLSDNSFNYPFLKIVAGAGNLKYMVMWAQMIDLKTPVSSYDNGYPKKWGVFHYLDWNVSKNLSIGIFESVIWQDADSTGKRGFDASYLIPIAFLRPVEFSVGSPDNALMGLNVKYSLSESTLIYGQFLLDEFRIREMTSGKGWWGNKFGVQLGARSENMFRIDRLNGLSEINVARPYTYAQRTSMLSYGHYNQPLAHPLGANFVEWMNIADYQYKRWYFRGQLMLAKYGLDSANTNVGKDIFQSYETRQSEYGNRLGQGRKTTLLYLQGTIAFLLNSKNNLRIEASVIGRREKNNIVQSNELIFQLGIRSTFRQFYYDF